MRLQVVLLADHRASGHRKDQRVVDQPVQRHHVLIEHRPAEFHLTNYDGIVAHGSRPDKDLHHPPITGGAEGLCAHGWVIETFANVACTVRPESCEVTAMPTSAVWAMVFSVTGEPTGTQDDGVPFGDT